MSAQRGLVSLPVPRVSPQLELLERLRAAQDLLSPLRLREIVTESAEDITMCAIIQKRRNVNVSEMPREKSSVISIVIPSGFAV